MAVSGVKEFEIKADPETVMKAVAAVDRCRSGRLHTRRSPSRAPTTTVAPPIAFAWPCPFWESTTSR